MQTSLRNLLLSCLLTTVFLITGGGCSKDGSSSTGNLYPGADFRFPLDSGRQWQFTGYVVDSLFDTLQHFLSIDTAMHLRTQVSIGGLDVLRGDTTAVRWREFCTFTARGVPADTLTSYFWYQNRNDGMYEIAYNNPSGYYVHPKRNATKNPLTLLGEAPADTYNGPIAYWANPPKRIAYPMVTGSTWNYEYSSETLSRRTVMGGSMFATPAGLYACTTIKELIYWYELTNPSIIYERAYAADGLVWLQEAWSRQVRTDETGLVTGYYARVRRMWRSG